MTDGGGSALRVAWVSLIGPVLVWGLIGCTEELRDSPRPVTSAFDDPASTRAGELFQAAVTAHPGESGFAIIRHGRPAFTSRIAFTELAERTLDVQYYIWEGDATGLILMDRLVRAADRGVRVRVLVDDINLTGRDDRAAALDTHPNIEVRVFNPFRFRDTPLLDFAIDMGRVNHRMHNKLMVVDNAMAIVGGRNIGDHYFEVAHDANFRDLDIAAAGPVVAEISEVFDHFWNGEWAVPMGALVERDYDAADLERTVAFLRQQLATIPYPHPLDQDVDALIEELGAIRDDFIWAPGEIVWDDPEAMKDAGNEGTMVSRLFRKSGSLKSELLIESAYFVPRSRGVDHVVGLTERGVRVRILTNSLASNDVLAAHAGHAKSRKRLVAGGVELYELRPDAGAVNRRSDDAEIRSALHTKAVVFDRASVFIGSFNLDPRSANINTEAGLYVESPELAAQVIAFMDSGVAPENAFRLEIEDDELVWITQEDDVEVRFTVDPHSSVWERLIAGAIALLPVEGQL